MSRIEDPVWSQSMLGRRWDEIKLIPKRIAVGVSRLAQDDLIGRES